MTEPTRSEVEVALANAIIRFEKEHLGRGPVDTRVFFIEDMILVRLRGVLTPAEQKLAQTPEGHDLVKRLRMQLIENSRSLLVEIIHQVVGCELISLHSDISVKTGERIMVFVVNSNLEERYRGKRRT